MSRQEKPLPPHGEHRRYRRGCRCILCCEAFSAARRAWRAGGSIAETNFVDAQQAREHVQRLEAGGMPLRLIARVAGVSSSAVQRLVHGRPKSNVGPTKRLEIDVAAKIMAVTLNSLARSSRMSSLGLRRRMEALAWLDFSPADVSAGTGLHVVTLIRLMRGESRINRQTHEQVRNFYESVLSRRSTQGPAHRRAVRLQFAPPWAWGDRIDDPTAEPDWAVPPPLGAVVASSRRNYVSAHDNDPVDAGFVRQYVRAELLGPGMTLSAVALQIEMPLSTLTEVMEGRNGLLPREIRAKTARSILRARFDVVVSGHGNTVDAMASRRRVHGMNWMGWTYPAIAREASLTKSFIAGISTGVWPTISYQSHLVILRAYVRLSGEIGPAILTRRRAVRNGYAPPMAWGDRSISQPGAHPDWGMEIHVPADLMLAQTRFLFMLGASFDEVAKITQQDIVLVRLQAASLGVGI